MTVPELSRELRRCASPCHPAVAEHDMITHLIAALRPTLRRICGTDPAGAEWTEANALVNFATIKEADHSLGTDEVVRSAAADASTGAAVNSGSRAPSVGGKRERPVDVAWLPSCRGDASGLSGGKLL